MVKLPWVTLIHVCHNRTSWLSEGPTRHKKEKLAGISLGLWESRCVEIRRNKVDKTSGHRRLFQTGLCESREEWGEETSVRVVDKLQTIALLRTRTWCLEVQRDLSRVPHRSQALSQGLWEEFARETSNWCYLHWITIIVVLDALILMWELSQESSRAQALHSAWRGGGDFTFLDTGPHQLGGGAWRRWEGGRSDFICLMKNDLNVALNLETPHRIGAKENRIRPYFS